jgi:RNA polymerase sigma factor (sigma-70 family)
MLRNSDTDDESAYLPRIDPVDSLIMLRLRVGWIAVVGDRRSARLARDAATTMVDDEGRPVAVTSQCTINNDHLISLCGRLGRGDAAAAEEVFLSYEPYLRMVVRRQLTPRLRAKFDSIDVVQSVWADVLHGLRDMCWDFPDEAHLKAFLIRSTLNRFISFYRQHRTSLEREQPLSSCTEGLPASRQDRPSEVVQADELWDQLLELSPPDHHELLRLKNRGASLAEIASRTGLHESSIRRILYKLEDRFDALEAGCA